MSGFAPEWLSLREGADHRARNAGLLAALGKHFSTRDAVIVVDLGAGLGSNLRAAAPALPARQHWVLVDHDPVLLAGACDAIANWADSVRPATAGLEVMRADRSIRVEVRRADLAKDPGAFATHAPDLVTAAALFDLVSEDWIGRFTVALAAARVPLYVVLNYDGTNTWSPLHPADAAMVAAFNRHQSSDKGFGSAAGSRATDLLAERLAAAGYRIERGTSPWRLGAGETVLMRVLTQGFAEAVRETGEVPAATIDAWLKARMADGVTCTVGHEDILAIPR
ncbi:MAG TPA: hypothetical protein VIG34_04435 [Xanthobacteraceae bacterium]|jgi:hypothetical protein